MIHAGGLPHRPLPPSLFPSKCPPPFAQFQVSTQVLAFVHPTRWVQHSHHASTSPSSTLLRTRLCPPSIPTLLAPGPTRFPRRRCTNFAAVGTVVAGNNIFLMGVVSPPVDDAVGRLALSASTTSRINRRYAGTSIGVRTLQTARLIAAVVAYTPPAIQGLDKDCKYG